MVLDPVVPMPSHKLACWTALDNVSNAIHATLDVEPVLRNLRKSILSQSFGRIHLDTAETASGTPVSKAKDGEGVM